MPDSATVQGGLHIDRRLTNFAIDYAQDASGFIANRAATRVPVLKASDKFIIYDRGAMWRDEMEPRPLGGRPVQTSKKHTDGTYSAVEYALADTIDDRQRANTDEPYNLDRETVRQLQQKRMIRMDRHWVQTCLQTGVWAADITGVASSPGAGQVLQFDQSGSDPISVIDQYKDLVHSMTGMMPNTLVLGADVKRALRSNPDIYDRMPDSRFRGVTNETLATAFELDNVLEARSIYNAAIEGATDDFQYIVNGKQMWLGYVAPNPGTTNVATAVAMFEWTGLIPGGAGSVVERGRDNLAYSDHFHVRGAWDIKAVASDLGVYFQSMVA